VWCGVLLGLMSHPDNMSVRYNKDKLGINRESIHITFAEVATNSLAAPRCARRPNKHQKRGDLQDLQEEKRKGSQK
jgi:hypothetical protein